MSTYLNGDNTKEGNARHLSRLLKPVVFVKKFPMGIDNEDFAAYHKACEWLKSHGIDYGSMERGLPIGLGRNADISKWSGLMNYGKFDDAKDLEGIMTCAKSFRYGAVTVFLTFNPEEDQNKKVIGA